MTTWNSKVGAAIRLSRNVPCRHWGEAQVQLYPYLTLVLEGVGRSTSCPGNFTYRKETQYPLHRRLVGATVLLHNVGFWCGSTSSTEAAACYLPTIHPSCHHHKTERLTSFLRCELSCAAWVPLVGETAGHTRRTWMASYPGAASCDPQNLSGTCKHCVTWLYSSHRLIMFDTKTSCGKQYDCI